jgi:hypothetical protein
MAIVNYHPSPVTIHFFFHCEHTSERNLATFTHHHSLFGHCERGFSEEDNTSSIQANGSHFELPGLQKFDKVRVNERNYEKVRNMHVNWYAAGIKALIGKMGKDLFVKLSKGF